MDVSSWWHYEDAFLPQQEVGVSQQIHSVADVGSGLWEAVVGGLCLAPPPAWEAARARASFPWVWSVVTSDFAWLQLAPLHFVGGALFCPGVVVLSR